jgi:hypothetical protein
MLALVARIHALNTAFAQATTWMVGTSPTMTDLASYAVAPARISL